MKLHGISCPTCIPSRPLHPSVGQAVSKISLNRQTFLHLFFCWELVSAIFLWPWIDDILVEKVTISPNLTKNNFLRFWGRHLLCLYSLCVLSLVMMFKTLMSAKTKATLFRFSDCLHKDKILYSEWVCRSVVHAALRSTSSYLQMISTPKQGIG